MRGTRRVAGRRRRVAALAVSMVSLAAFGLGACTSARDTLGTNSSPCFRALPIAEDAVHDRGTFAGVRLVAATVLKQFNHVYADLEARSTTPLRNVCVMSYHGTFTLDDVERPAGNAPAGGMGRIAVVVVSTPQNVLLATFVLEKEPVRFRHYVLGG